MDEREALLEVRYRVMYDPDPENPRDWDNLGKLVCWHRRWKLGDEQPYCTPEEYEREHFKPDTIVLPVWMLDHSGLALATRSFNDPWDSGQVGWIYVQREDVRKEYNCKRVTADLESLVRQRLAQEVSLYGQYLNGEVYMVEWTIHCPGQLESTDACGGFFSVAEASCHAELELKFHKEAMGYGDE